MRCDMYSLSDHDVTRFASLAREKSGLEFPEARRPDLARAVERAMVENGLSDTNALFALFREAGRGQAALSRFISSLTIGETYFFRNRPQFEALERCVLPELIDRRRDERRLRIWSAACASGEETYSLSIVLHRLLPDLASWDVLILGTDINPQALARARQGVYGAWSFRDTPAAVRDRYFMRHGQEFEIAHEIRRPVAFAPLNFILDDYPSLLSNTTVMDLILCRNVFIYFSEETTRRVVSRLYNALVPGGWLVVGHAEFSQAAFDQFHIRNLPGAVLYQKPEGRSPACRNAAARSLIDIPIVRRLAPSQEIAWKTPPVATSAWRGMTEAQPVVAELEVMEARSLWEAGQPDAALSKLSMAATVDLCDAQPPYLAARICASRSQFEDPRRWLAMAIERAPFFAAAHYLQGMVHQEEGRFDDALAALRRTVYADEGFVLGHFALANLFLRLGQDQRARKAFACVVDLVADCRPDSLVPEGDGLTVGRLLETIRSLGI